MCDLFFRSNLTYRYLFKDVAIAIKHPMEKSHIGAQSSTNISFQFVSIFVSASAQLLLECGKWNRDGSQNLVFIVFVRVLAVFVV